MNKDKNFTRINVFLGTALAIGALAFAGGGDNPQIKKTKFLAHCPGGQDIAYVLHDDSKENIIKHILPGEPDQHQATMTCSEDGTSPSIGRMSDEWQDDDPQTLVGQINKRFPGRVIVEVATNQLGDKFVGVGENGFLLGNEDGQPTQPIVLTEEHPINKIQTFTP